MQDFKNLSVWEKSHRLVLAIYNITEDFPKSEVYGLTSQLRNSVVSIPANIAEGCGKESESDFKRYLQIALGSANETQYYILLARDLKLFTNENYERLEAQVSEVRRMLIALIKKIRGEVSPK